MQLKKLSFMFCPAETKTKLPNYSHKKYKITARTIHNNTIETKIRK